jgi:hypothetical protein
MLSNGHLMSKSRWSRALYDGLLRGTLRLSNTAVLPRYSLAKVCLSMRPDAFRSEPYVVYGAL